MTRSDYWEEYMEGYNAAVRGLPLWENPHIAGGFNQFNAWFAGWCEGKRIEVVKD